MAEAGEVKLHFLDYWRVIRVRWGIILLVFLLVLITASVTTYFMPKKYQSSVSMQLNFDPKVINIFNQGFSGGGMAPLFIETQNQIIQKKEILYPVIERLKLEEKWGVDGQKLPREFTWYKLRGMLKVRQLRNTELLELTAESTDPKEAAEVANAVAQIYVERRDETVGGRKSVALAEIKKQVEEQRAKVDEIQANVNRLRGELFALGIVENSDNPNGFDSTTLTTFLEKERLVNAAKTEIATRKSLLGHVEKLSVEQLLDSLTGLNISDPTVSQIHPLLKSATAERARLLQSGLGPKHPSVSQIQAQIDVYEKQLKTQSESIRQVLATDLRIKESSLEALEEQLKEARAKQQDAKTKSSEYVTAKQKLQIETNLFTSLDQKYQMESMATKESNFYATVWEYAEPASQPSSPNWSVNLVVGAVIGIAVGIGLAFFIEYLDTSVKTMEDVENFLGVPVLAIIPKDIDLLHKVSGDTPDAEAYRILRTNIEFNRKSATANTISMVSGGPGEGKSTTLANMAYTFAQGGYSVLIVDADLRRPMQHKLFSMTNDVGLTTYLTTDIKLEDVIFPTGFESLQIMPSGILPTDAVGILNSQRMSDMITELKGRYDMVFFDSPPILGVSDASVLASEVDLCILVVQHRRFPRAMLTRVKQSVTNVGGTILGVVLNNVDLKHDPNYQYYTSYYDYYAPRREHEAAPEPSPNVVSSGNRSPRDDDQY